MNEDQQLAAEVGRILRRMAEKLRRIEEGSSDGEYFSVAKDRRCGHAVHGDAQPKRRDSIDKRKTVNNKRKVNDNGNHSDEIR